MTRREKRKKNKLEWQCKAFCVSRKRNNCNRKVKDFRKLSNEEIYNKPFKSIFLWPKCMEEHHIPSPDIWRKISTDWFIKCSNGYVFCIWYKFIHFLPFIELATHQISCVPDVKYKLILNPPSPLTYVLLQAVQNMIICISSENMMNLNYTKLVLKLS